MMLRTPAIRSSTPAKTHQPLISPSSFIGNPFRRKTALLTVWHYSRRGGYGYSFGMGNRFCAAFAAPAACRIRGEAAAGRAERGAPPPRRGRPGGGAPPTP